MYRFVKIKGYKHWLLYADSTVEKPINLFKFNNFYYHLLVKINGIVLFKRNGNYIIYNKQLIIKAKLFANFPYDDGTFEIGDIPFNKGKKMTEYLTPEQIQKIQKTQFVTGVNVGENNVCWKGGVQHMTKDCAYINTGANERVRRPKMVYEREIGELPKGFVIVHKNSNKDDDSPDNLLAISRGDLMKLNSPKDLTTMEDLIEKYFKLEEEVKLNNIISNE